MNNPTDDYDSPWKEALTRYFAEFLDFYFPLAHQAIDWTQPHTFLDQELPQIVRDGEIGKRRIDRLVQVTTLNATVEWVYIHIEIQTKSIQTLPNGYLSITIVFMTVIIVLSPLSQY
jgi:hypothetical protein